MTKNTNLICVTLNTRFKNLRSGETAGFDASDAHELVRLGAAVYVNEADNPNFNEDLKMTEDVSPKVSKKKKKKKPLGSRRPKSRKRIMESDSSSDGEYVTK